MSDPVNNLNPEEQGVEFDLGNLLTIDPRPLEVANKDDLESTIHTEMVSLARMFFKQIWSLPLERVDDTVVATLPEPSARLPREKPAPKPKAMTKWEKYAKEKGIQKRTKDRMVWDDNTKTWKPRFGYGKAKKAEDDWVVEVPHNSTGMDDPFEARETAKKERVAKNELQRLRNVARAHKTKVPTGGVIPQTDSHRPSKNQVGQAAAYARISTASAGKFDENLPKEKPPKIQGKKRKFEDNTSSGKSERDRMLNLANEVVSKKPRTESEGGNLGRVNRRSTKKPKADRKDGGDEERGNRKSFQKGKKDGRGGGPGAKGKGKAVSGGGSGGKQRKPVKR